MQGMLYVVDGVDCNLAYIPPTFIAQHTEEFDTVYMNALFDLAYMTDVTGYPWDMVPPGYKGAE